MSEYDILLKPTRISEKWFEVPHITTCGVNKETVKTWEDVVACAKEFGYDYNVKDKFIFKQLEKDSTIYFTKNKGVFLHSIHFVDLEYNKMVLFMLLLENKL